MKPILVHLQALERVLNSRFSRRGMVWMVSVVLAVFFATLYFAFCPSVQRQGWDSLSYAYAVEQRGMHAVHGNHPLGHIVTNLVFLLARDLGYQGRALPVFVLVNSICGGLAVGCLYATCISVLGSGFLCSFGLAVLFAAAGGMWRFVGTGDIYSISVLSLVLAWSAIAWQGASGTRYRSCVSGALVGLSITAHQFSVLMLPVGVLASWQNERCRVRNALTFAVFALFSAVLGYFLAGAMVTGSVSPVPVLQWACGYFKSSAYGHFMRWDCVPMALSTLQETVLNPGWNRISRIARSVMLCLVASLWLSGVLRFTLLSRFHRVILASAWLVCIAGCGLIQWWEPWNPKFWLLMWVHAAVAVALSLAGPCVGTSSGSSLAGRLTLLDGPLLASLGGLALLFNLWFGALPQRTDTEEFTRALGIWVSNSEPDDVLITAGGLTHQLRFWMNRPHAIPLASVLRNPDSDKAFAYLRDEIEGALTKGASVLVALSAVRYMRDNSIWMPNMIGRKVEAFFAEYEWEEAFLYKNDIDGRNTPVSRIIGRKQSAESAGSKSPGAHPQKKETR
jgi:hypothetical protein